MRIAFDDPILALVRVKRYEDDAAGMYYAMKNIFDTLHTAGVRYQYDEPAGRFGLANQ